MNNLKNFDVKELNLILESLQEYDRHLATIIGIEIYGIGKNLKIAVYVDLKKRKNLKIG